MKALKKILGIVWIALGVYVGYLSIAVMGLPKVTSGKQEDLVFGLIILIVLTPIVVGSLVIFGYYALSGDYND